MRTDQKLFCLKAVLTAFLCLLWVVGAAIFGVILWLRLDFWTNEYLRLDSKLERYLILIYISLSAGAVIVAFSIFGLIGGCIKKKWLLIVYLTAVVIAILLTVSAVVYGVVYRDELERTVLRSNLIQNIVRNEYRDGDKTSRIKRAVDIMQAELECCGGNGPLDYQQSNWLLQYKNTGNLEEKLLKSVPVPATCCKNYYRYEGDKILCYVYQLDTDKVKSGDIWHKGCEESLSDFFDKYVVVVISIAAVFFVLQLICMIICSILIHLLNSLYVPQPDDIVYDMAHNQEKSPYPSRGDYREYYH